MRIAFSKQSARMARARSYTEALTVLQVTVSIICSVSSTGVCGVAFHSPCT